MSTIVATMTSPHQLPLHPIDRARPRESPTRGYKPPTTPAETAFAEGHKSSPSKVQRIEEPRGAYRAQSIKVIREANGDVDAFLEEVNNKRKQLDEQIHRYIKQKDREYKFFERDARIKYRNAGPKGLDLQPTASVPRSENGEDDTHEIEEVEEGPAEAAAAARRAARTSRAQSKSADSGLKDPAVSKEREADLLGVFTPTYISLLNQDPTNPRSSDINLTTEAVASSAPSTTSLLSTPNLPSDRMLLRANSDPVDEKYVAEPTRVKLEKRTSSSGSESRNLVSALKSPIGNTKAPKRKRVSIVVGDEVVAPSDNVPADNEQAVDDEIGRIDFAPRHTADHHSIGGEPRERPLPQNGQSIVDNVEGEEDDAAAPVGESHDPQDEVRDQPPAFRASFTPRRESSLTSALALSRANDPSADPVFNFSDNDLATDESKERPPSDPEDALDASPSRGSVSPGTTRKESQGESAERIPVPIPRRTSSTSSSQPISPGFSRPSVQSDAVISFDEDIATPEIERNGQLGSLPEESYSFVDRTGSLGESFMEMNAEALRKSGRRRPSASAS